MALPLRTLPGQAWPAVPAANLSQLWGFYLELQRTQWLSPEEIVAGQLAQVRTLVAHCKQQVPYYQESLRQIVPEDLRSLEDFRRIPILPRSAFNEHFVRFQARQLPAGMVKVNEDASSGTSGVAIAVWQTNHVSRWWHALNLRDWDWSGIDPRGVLASIRVFASAANVPGLMDGLAQSSWNKHLDALLETGPMHAMDIRQEPKRQLEWLLRVRPDYLFSYASTLEVLASYLLESGQRLPGLRLVQSISETLTEESRTRMETAFGAPVKNLYSCTEAGYLASPCPEGHGLHVHAENVVLEVLDEQNRPCKPGETGRVVLTALHNFITPFVRYDIMDYATVGPERCPCGRGLPLLLNVQGKLRPLFHLADGRRKASTFLLDLLKMDDICHQYQIIQRSLNHVVVRLAPKRSWTDANADHIARVVQDYFETPLRIDIECVDRVEMTAAGKMRNVVVEVT